LRSRTAVGLPCDDRVVNTPHPPNVERVLVVARPLAGPRDPAAVLSMARAVVDEERERLASGGADARSAEALGREVADRLVALERGAGPDRLINATGVIVHTNLGRAPWPDAAVRAARDAAEGSLFLELDRSTGRRGRRSGEAEGHLVALTGAEDALIVTNNAAAVALAVGLAGRGGVAVSRGELVEIGGGVRIPEIVRRAGARLVEVGTTNRTRVADFEEVLADGRARLVLRVHPSNFAQTGFVEAPDAPVLAEAAHRHGALVVDDLGSGALLDTAAFGLAHEPMPRERLADGADLVTFSGDKLVGGPQAGFVVGRAELVARLRKDPLARAMRPDKVMLAAIAATLALYRAGVAAREVPVWRQLSAPVEELAARAAAVADAVGSPATVVAVEATVGGGSLPGQVLPSRAVRLASGAPDRLLARLRTGDPAVIGRIEAGAVVLDLRSVEPADDAPLVAAIAAALARHA
jgi:L-seryl-tRNA(Ser) seleniumtransferase